MDFLRHTYLTLLAQSGVHPKVMQELAGHYICQITMDTYTHVNMVAKQQAVSAVSGIFSPRPSANALPEAGNPEGAVADVDMIAVEPIVVDGAIGKAC